VDIRLIAATNASLDTLVETGTFRQDLLFRLKVLHIQVPPLRSRKQDIPDIALSFLERLNETNKTKKRFGQGNSGRSGDRELRW
jgi:DNA-binding NtrC family response regulator